MSESLVRAIRGLGGFRVRRRVLRRPSQVCRDYRLVTTWCSPAPMAPTIGLPDQAVSGFNGPFRPGLT